MEPVPHGCFENGFTMFDCTFQPFARDSGANERRESGQKFDEQAKSDFIGNFECFPLIPSILLPFSP